MCYIHEERSTGSLMRKVFNNNDESLPSSRTINLDQFNLPRSSVNDDFDQVYAANVKPANNATTAAAGTPPASPGEKIVLMCGPKAVDPKRYQRDYVVGGSAARHVTKNTTSLRRYRQHIPYQ